MLGTGIAYGEKKNVEDGETDVEPLGYCLRAEGGGDVRSVRPVRPVKRLVQALCQTCQTVRACARSQY